MPVETCPYCTGLGTCPRCHGWGVDGDGARCAACGADGRCPNPRCRGGLLDVRNERQRLMSRSSSRYD
jgi:hypothetical protein